jgi:hypothetical protein
MANEIITFRSQKGSALTYGEMDNNFIALANSSNNKLSNTHNVVFEGSLIQKGNLIPVTTNAYDIGSAALRWRNLYINDLNLSNGIGDYTIIEGEHDLFIINNNSGKHFKFALIEVDPSIVPPKKLNAN